MTAGPAERSKQVFAELARAVHIAERHLAHQGCLLPVEAESASLRWRWWPANGEFQVWRDDLDFAPGWYAMVAVGLRLPTVLIGFTRELPQAVQLVLGLRDQAVAEAEETAHVVRDYLATLGSPPPEPDAELVEEPPGG